MSLRQAMTTKLFVLFSAFLALPVALFAQAKGSSAGSTSPAANPTLGPEASSDIGKFSDWETLSRQGKTGDYLLG